MEYTIATKEAKYWEALTEVMDPEFPISVVDMGLIYDIKENEGIVDVNMSFTASSCGCKQFIEEDVEKRLLQEDGVKEVNINIVWEPAWTVDRLSAKAREQLKHWGVSTK